MRRACTTCPNSAPRSCCCPDRVGCRTKKIGFGENLPPERLEKSKTPVIFVLRNAEIAQSVEHQLPKLRVAGSNPVFRSRGPFRRTFFVGQGCTIGSKRFCISTIYGIVSFLYHSKRQQAKASFPCAESWYMGVSGRNVPHFFGSALNHIGLRRMFRTFQSYDCQTQNVFGRWKENDSA